MFASAQLAVSVLCSLGPLQQTIPVTIKMGIPTPINANKIIPHQIIPHLHAQEPISQVSLDSVKVAINTNNHWGYSIIPSMVYLGSHPSAFTRCSTTLHKSLVSMAVWKGNCHRTGDRSLGKQSWDRVWQP